MQYNSEAQNLDCVSEVLAICGGITVTDYPINDITRRFNSALDTYFGWAFESDGRHSFDDINETSPPIDYQNIVSGTGRYKFSAFTEKVLNVIKIELLDGDAKIVPLTVDTMDQLKTRGENFDTVYTNADAGTPTKYLKYGDFIYFDKKPDWSEADGLLAYFDRPASYMAYDDTTKVPGVPVIHHTILCRMTALPWLIENKSRQKNDIADQVDMDKITVEKHFARSSKDTRKRFTPLKQNNR